MVRMNNKGVSTVIGTVFLMLIIFMVSTNVLLWTFSQNALYTQAEKEVDQDEADRRNEKVVATDGNYSVSGNEVTVEATLTNAGSVAAHIVNLWAFDTDPSNRRYNYTLLNLNLNPGDVLNLVGSSGVTVTIPGAHTDHNFVSYFVTARGNTIPVTVTESTNDTIVAQVALGIGAVGMDFGSFVYYNVSDYNLQVWPDGKEGFYVPKGNNIAFRVILTNFDVNKRTIYLASHSALWIIFKTNLPQQPRSGWWHLVNINGTTGTITSKTEDTFSDIPLFYSQPTMVYFASEDDLSTDDFKLSSPGWDGPATVNLMLFGTIDGSTFGQNIPFVSIYVRTS